MADWLQGWWAMVRVVGGLRGVSVYFFIPFRVDWRHYWGDWCGCLPINEGQWGAGRLFMAVAPPALVAATPPCPARGARRRSGLMRAATVEAAVTVSAAAVAALVAAEAAAAVAAAEAAQRAP